MKNEMVQINESEYEAILLQAVAVIEDARQSVAMHVATILFVTTIVK